jgi:hypothetical protein
MTRRGIWIPDDLWQRIQRAAAESGAREGRPVSAAEWIRAAGREKLERDS